MSRPITPQTHPFPFLLYLEWALLAIAALNLLSPAPLLRDTQFPLLTFISLTGFSALGLYLPTGKLIQRIGHVALQLVLIVLTSGFGFSSLRLFPFLYLVLVIRSCFMFTMPGRLILTATAFVLFFGNLQIRLRNIGGRIPRPLQGLLANFHLNFLILFCLSLAFVLLLVNALLSERASQEKLRRANQQLRESASQIEKLAMAQERGRIARDIHDSVGHSLTALNLQLESALKLWPTDSKRAYQFLADAKTLGSTALQDVRQSVAALRQDPVANQRLEAAIADLAHQVEQTTGIQPEVSILLPSHLSKPLKITLYRIVQEALTNITKHAQAGKIRVALYTRNNQIRLEIEDNGRGFQPTQTTTGFGLQSIRERVQTAGGRVALNTAPGQGTCLQIDMPL